jgi:hypothetical protein
MSVEISILAGFSFQDSLSKLDGAIPPAYSFPNRFLNAEWSEWIDSFASLDPPPDDVALRTSLDGLTVLLAQVCAQGAPLPVLLALEYGVTANLAWLTWLMAKHAVQAHGLTDTSTSARWGTNEPTVDACAELIRIAAQSAVAACAHNTFYYERPDRVLVFVVGYLRQLAAPLLTSGSLVELEAASHDAIGRSLSAILAASKFAATTSPTLRIPPAKSIPAARVTAPPTLSRNSSPAAPKPSPQYVRLPNKRTTVRRRWIAAVSAIVVLGGSMTAVAIVHNRSTRSHVATPQSTPAVSTPHVLTEALTTPVASSVVEAVEAVEAVAIATTSTVPEAQRIDVALYTAQALATALASGDWATARQLNRKTPETTDAEYKASYDVLDRSFVALADSRVNEASVDLWLTLEASEHRATGRQTTIYCVHWQYLEAAHWIEQAAGEQIRSVSGYSDASVLKAEDTKSCHDFDH